MRRRNGNVVEEAEAHRRCALGMMTGRTYGTESVLRLTGHHQIDRQPFHAPVGMRLNQLMDEIDIGRVRNLQQHNRQIAGDGVAPKPGLPTPSARKKA